MSPARIEVDFIPPRRRVPLSGLLFLIVGAFAAVWTFEDLRGNNITSELLAMSIGRYQERKIDTEHQLVSVDPSEVDSARRQLLTPWSQLLRDLELAAQDNEQGIALLEIAPNKLKGSVRISGEARSLVHVMDYVTTLQEAESLSFPMLERHEIQTSNRERPVRFIVVADWRILE